MTSQSRISGLLAARRVAFRNGGRWHEHVAPDRRLTSGAEEGLRESQAAASRPTGRLLVTAVEREVERTGAEVHRTSRMESTRISHEKGGRCAETKEVLPGSRMNREAVIMNSRPSAQVARETVSTKNFGKGGDYRRTTREEPALELNERATASERMPGTEDETSPEKVIMPAGAGTGDRMRIGAVVRSRRRCFLVP